MTEKKDKKKEDLRVGVFICDCGSNIAGHLNCTEVTEYADTLPGVVYTKENLYTCSESGIVRDPETRSRRHNLNQRCRRLMLTENPSPSFCQHLVNEAGLNPVSL